MKKTNSLIINIAPRLIACLLCCLQILNPSSIAALDPEQLKVINSGAYYFNIQEGNQCSNANSNGAQSGLGVGPGSVFVIGDSLTVGTVTSGGLLDKLNKAGFTTNTSVKPSDNGRHIEGSSVEATVGINVTNTNTQLSSRTDFQNAQIYLVALGTNYETNLKAKISTLVSTLKGSQNKTIVWVNTYFSPDENSTRANSEIAAASTTNGFKVIDYYSAAKGDSSLRPDAKDGVHMSTTGYKNKADFIVSQLKGNSSPAASTTASRASSASSSAQGSPLSKTDITIYSPQNESNPVEGGLDSSSPGPDGKALVRTLDDVASGASRYVTLAGDPSLYKKQYLIPEITYTSYASGTAKETNLKNVYAYVHDTGSAFSGKPEGRYDIAIGKDYQTSQIKGQGFASQIKLIPSTESLGIEASGVGSGGGGGSSCSFSTLPGNNEKEKIWNFLITKGGRTPEQAAGIMGNIMAESGFGPMRLQGTGGDTKTPANSAENSSLGWGLVQWTPAGKIITTAKDAKIPTNIIETSDFQMEFLWQQLKGEAWSGNPKNLSSEKSAGEAVFAAVGVDETAMVFAQKYERCKYCSPNNGVEAYQRSMLNRVKLARAVLAELGSSTAATGGAQ